MFSYSIVGAQLYVGDMLFVMISFLVLMWLVKIVAWKPITKMMQNRSDKIASDIDSAKESRTKAADLAEKRQTELQKTREDANGIINTAKQNGQEQREKKSLKMHEMKHLILRVLLKRILNNNDKKLWLILEKMWQAYPLKLQLRLFQKN